MGTLRVKQLIMLLVSSAETKEIRKEEMSGFVKEQSLNSSPRQYMPGALLPEQFFIVYQNVYFELP